MQLFTHIWQLESVRKPGATQCGTMMSFAAAFLTDFHHVPVTSPTGPILHRGHYTGTD